MLSTLTLTAGCAVQEYDRGEDVGEVRAAITLGNDKELNGGETNGGGPNGGGPNGGGPNGGGPNGGGPNGGGPNGGGPNGGGPNGGGPNGGGPNGGGPNGGGPNGGGPNGGGPNGGGPNGGGPNGYPLGPDAEITHYAFNLNTISYVAFDGDSGNDAFLREKLRNALLHKDLGPSHGHGHGHAYGHGGCDDDDESSLLDAKITGKLSDSSTISLNFEEEEKFTSVTGDAMSRYVVSFTRPGREGKGYVCGLRDGEPIKAIPITGKWNFGQGVPGGGSKSSNAKWLTFACQGYALYKCVDYGYPTWKNVNGVDLDDHHQACVRMLRADYCGDGTPFTVDGTYINMYDNLGIQVDTENWSFEAEWDPNGARCVSHERIANLGRSPACVFERASETCGNPVDWSATLLANESQ